MRTNQPLPNQDFDPKLCATCHRGEKLQMDGYKMDICQACWNAIIAGSRMFRNSMGSRYGSGRSDEPDNGYEEQLEGSWVDQVPHIDLTVEDTEDFPE